jgi:ribosomal protein L11 methyltransferase
VSWFSLRVESAAHRDQAIAALFATGAQGVHEDGQAIVTSFPGEGEARVAAAAVAAIDPAAICDVSPAPTIDWSVAWREHARAVTSGDLSIAPPWLAGDLDPRTTIVIEPGMAFGTGDHASTRGAMLLMQRALRRGMTVADLGSGSAVLSIAAAKLGASRVWAIELDPEAQENAADNVARNDVTDVVSLFEGDAGVFLPLIAPVDLVAINIISSVIVELLPTIGASVMPGGFVVLAGILDSEHHVVLDALQRERWQVITTHVEEDWWSALAQRP